MKVFNVTSGLFESDDDLCRAIVNVKDGVFELGYCSYDDPELVTCNMQFASIYVSYVRLNSELKKIFVYSNYYGKYIYIHATGSSDLRMALTRYGRGDFPYQINREYEAVKCFHAFDNKQKILDFKEYELAKYLKYTFGVEFESYSGYIPENLCFRDGLIPLRDGSLDGGIEYSTIVLDGNYGLNLLNQQIDTLNKYTLFNKECSLHFHFGNFPVNDIYIWSLYLVWQQVNASLNAILPKYTYNTSYYKKSEKDYCKQLPVFNTFNEMYEAFTTQKYFGNLYQPHPKDPHQTSKWNVHGRYYCLNLINMLCYKSPKTVEFRFLRPTYNKHKIMFWLYIFNAVLITAERVAKECKELNDVNMSISKSDFSIFSILFATYPPEIADKLIHDYHILEQIIYIQHDLNDYTGSRIDIEDKLFDPNIVI
jgi:hypothetical protein